MTQDDKKRAAATAALDLVPAGAVIGVGTGSTANHFIDALAGRAGVEAVASSTGTARRLAARGIRVIELADADLPLPVYVDGADEATRERSLIKGGGGALTREKILAAASLLFVCVIDDAKLVGHLGAFPLAVEVIPMARSHVARELRRMGGEARPRAEFVTDNGNAILDVRGLDFTDAAALESALDQIAGVVAHGLFCRRPADLLLVGGDNGVIRL